MISIVKPLMRCDGCIGFHSTYRNSRARAYSYEVFAGVILEGWDFVRVEPGRSGSTDHIQGKLQRTVLILANNFPEVIWT